MHPEVFRQFDILVRQHFRGGNVLEVGAVPGADSLLNLECLKGSKKIGVNLVDTGTYSDFEVVQCDANDMNMFPSDSFDLVMSNATLEHDRHFWKSLAEMRRLCRPGGSLIVGVPGFASRTGLLSRIPFLPESFRNGTPTFHLHRSPGTGDYYRFSEECVREVFLDGFSERKTFAVLTPPRIIGIGKK